MYKIIHLSFEIALSNLQFIHYLPNFIDFNCPASKQLTKKTFKIGAGESVMYNTNPDGADK